LQATTFNVDPIDSGIIVCNEKELPINAHIRSFFDSRCEAEPNQGYTFVSWTEGLPNSSRIISKSQLSNSLWEHILNGLGIELNDNSTINVKSSGNFVANFRAIPQPIPQEYLLGLYTLSATIFTGWLIPNLTRYLSSRKQNKKSFLQYIEIAKSVRNSNLNHLEVLQDRINNEYAIGGLNESHYNLLSKNIETQKRKLAAKSGIDNSGVSSPTVNSSK
jgi:hypothetical protein